VKVLLDSCVWGGAAAPLRAAGHDVAWAGDWDEDPGDDAILAAAYSEKWALPQNLWVNKRLKSSARARGKPIWRVLDTTVDFLRQIQTPLRNSNLP